MMIGLAIVLIILSSLLALLARNIQEQEEGQTDIAETK